MTTTNKLPDSLPALPPAEPCEKQAYQVFNEKIHPTLDWIYLSYSAFSFMERTCGIHIPDADLLPMLVAFGFWSLSGIIKRYCPKAQFRERFRNIPSGFKNSNHALEIIQGLLTIFIAVQYCTTPLCIGLGGLYVPLLIYNKHQEDKRKEELRANQELLKRIQQGDTDHLPDIIQHSNTKRYWSASIALTTAAVDGLYLCFCAKELIVAISPTLTIPAEAYVAFGIFAILSAAKNLHYELDKELLLQKSAIECQLAIKKQHLPQVTTSPIDEQDPLVKEQDQKASEFNKASELNKEVIDLEQKLANIEQRLSPNAITAAGERAFDSLRALLSGLKNGKAAASCVLLFLYGSVNLSRHSTYVCPAALYWSIITPVGLLYATFLVTKANYDCDKHQSQLSASFFKAQKAGTAPSAEVTKKLFISTTGPTSDADIENVKNLNDSSPSLEQFL